MTLSRNVDFSIPRMSGMRTTFTQLPAYLLSLAMGPDRIKAMEAWGSQALPEPHSAVYGHYVEHPLLPAEKVVMGQFWILCHNPYLDGTKKLEIRIRECRNGETHHWVARNDELIHGIENGVQVQSVHTRLTGKDKSGEWVMTFENAQRECSLAETDTPAYRAADLFSQVMAKAGEMRRWLQSELHTIEGFPHEVAALFNRNLVMLADLRYSPNTSLQLPTDDEWRGWLQSTSRRVNQHKQRVSNEATVALFDFLHREYEQMKVRRLQREKGEAPPASVAQLLEFHSRWVHLLSTYVDALLK